MTDLDRALAATRYQSYVYAYPHKTAYRPIDPPRPLAPLWAGERRDALFLYLHIPFCEQRCGFCNLFTRPVPEVELVDAYLATLSRQAHVVRRALDAGGQFAIARAAIGGGTPTLLDACQLERVIGLARTLGLAPGVPMSVETSPDTALPDRLAVVVGAGADRISIGVQSFIDAECKAVNRPQRAADVHRALRAIRDAGPATLNLDLMYGLPGQTAATWQTSLAAALDYRPEELYLYPLYVRPLTTLGRRADADAGAGAGPEIDHARVALYEQARDVLRAAGYHQVSLRMFRRGDAPVATAGPIYRCQDDGMIGVGCGARSYTRGVHYSTEWAVGARGVRDILARWVQRDDAGFAVADYGFVLDGDEQRRRWLILALLSEHGVDRAGYRARFGGDPLDDFPALARLAPRGLAEATPATLRLTAGGLARADALGPWLYSPAVARRMTDYELT
ncbi:MAG TPA: STM4012 family radical SAM protein [Kofleriaceae bacterium]|nr:STM4012 family radical SAM protein [Kofleriaceae bacterium]